MLTALSLATKSSALARGFLVSMTRMGLRSISHEWDDGNLAILDDSTLNLTEGYPLNHHSHSLVYSSQPEASSTRVPGSNTLTAYLMPVYTLRYRVTARRRRTGGRPFSEMESSEALQRVSYPAPVDGSKICGAERPAACETSLGAAQFGQDGRSRPRGDKSVPPQLRAEVDLRCMGQNSLW